ncbi:hypothetical protein Micbo1qcDRAFT_166962 [Microdochium bolleyi]|uniref:UBZ4-type domain-containing protein n=1 Tax=Microdochium bolleyi TaxID=196109 RepID=A0A136ITI7_9PEZI|nr:hypothetical protein Micbo1qcDRAFT_166962 [Microdochium bolleyi]
MSHSQPVPRTTQVIPGATVNIVLKADQRTGRQVSGTVRDVLTRGDHHRGIKVRLADGRIGRVQSLARPAASGMTVADGTSSSPSAVGGDDPATVARDLQIQQYTRRPGKYRDIREDEPLEAPAEQTDLSAYIKPARPRGKGKKATTAYSNGNEGADLQQPPPPGDVVSATVTCPVCSVFEGDEAAVAHHVAEHFE